MKGERDAVGELWRWWGKYPALEAISTGDGRSGWWIGSYRIGRGVVGGSCTATDAVDVEGDAGSSLSKSAIPRLLCVGLGDGSLESTSRMGS